MENAKQIYKSSYGKEKILSLYNSILSRWPVPYEHIVIPTNYGDTFIIASGNTSSPSILLLHGSGSNSATWAHDVIEFSKHLRVYAADIPGEPGKSSTNRFSCKSSAFENWIDEILNSLNVDKIILCGISLGAWASLKYGVYKPQRVSRLAAICPSGVCRLRWFSTMQLIGWSLLGDLGHDKIIRILFKNEPVSEEAVDFLKLTFKYFNFRTDPIPLFSDQQLKRLTMPVIFISGAKDVFINPYKVTERLKKFVPDLVTNIFEEEGHAAVNKASYIMPFLNL